MTRVWVTAYGGRYHSRADCQGIRDGHEKAASEGRAIHPPELVPLRQAGVRELSACARCWSEEFGRDDWASKVHSTELLAETEYESLFLSSVLRRVRGLDPRDVDAQREVHGASGALYRVDFVIDRPGHQLIALEVDGWEKTFAGNELRPEARDRANERRHDLENAGLRILNFSNSKVSTEPDTCIRQIERALEHSSASSRTSSSTHSGASATAAEHAVPVVPSAVYVEPSAWPVHAEQTYDARAQRPSHNALGWVLLVSLLVAGGAFVYVIFGAVAFEGDSDAGVDSQVAVPDAGRCPPTHQIKGNRSQSGDWIYHAPGWKYYSQTDPEECFATTGAAGRAGYRASEVR